MRGQITAFIIVGVVLVITVGFAIYMMGKIGEKNPVIDVSPEKSGLRNCVENAAEAAMVTLGANGGIGTADQMVIDSQGGKTRIGIKAGGTNGLLNFQPLCTLGGTNNQPGQSDSCMQGTYQSGESNSDVFQYVLEQSIQQNVVSCGVDSPVMLTFGADDVTVSTSNVSVLVPVRFKRMYDVAYMIAIKDIQNKKFDKRNIISLRGCTNEQGNNCIFPGLIVNVDDTPDGKNTVLRLTDTTHKVGGLPFLFEYAIEDRPPSILSVTEGTSTISTNSVIATTAGKLVTVTVVDPDEDQIEVTCTADPDSISDCGTTTINGFGTYTFNVIAPSAATHGDNLGTVTITATNTLATKGKSVSTTISVYA